MAGLRGGRWAVAIGLVAVGAIAFASACSVVESFDNLTGGEGGTLVTDNDGGGAIDSGSPFDDGSTFDSGSTNKSNDGGGGDNNDDASVRAKDGGGTNGFACKGTDVASCNACAGSPEPCITCDSSGNTTAFCAAAGATCRNVAPGAFTHGCGCNVASDCPAKFQVCVSAPNGFCHTCGEPNSSGVACNGGGTCAGTMCN